MDCQTHRLNIFTYFLLNFVVEWLYFVQGRPIDTKLESFFLISMCSLSDYMGLVSIVPALFEPDINFRVLR